MNKILFICHGNICRSPMAEFIFKDMLKKCGREAEFIVVSSATSTEEIWNGIGNPVYPSARAELANHGIFCKEKRAIQLKKSDYDKYDLFLCMGSRNVTNTLRIFGGDPDNKVRKLLKNKDVSDPWYTDRFDVAYNDIYEGCRQLLESLWCRYGIRGTAAVNIRRAANIVICTILTHSVTVIAVRYIKQKRILIFR